MQPSIGRIVHYLEGEGVTRAALVVAVHEQTDPQLRYVDVPLADLVTDEAGNVLNEREVAVDSDGEPIYDPGTEAGDVSLVVFREDGSTFAVPTSPEFVEHDGEGEDDRVQKPGSWSWPPRV